MSPRRRGFVVATVLSAFALSCQVLIGNRDDDFTIAPPPGADASDARPPVPPKCGATLLGPPDGGSGGPEGTFYFGLKTIKLGGEAQSDGFNLDFACTCGEQPDADTRGNCRRPPDAYDASAAEACDSDGGVDNAFFQFTESYASATVEGLNSGIGKAYACGRENLIFVLQKYNGLADDDDVILAAVRSHGIVEDTRPDAGHGGCGDNYPARFDGTDPWAIDPDLVGAGGIVKLPSIHGYVTNYKLVADGRTGSGTLQIAGLGRPSPILERPVLVANLEVTEGHVEMKSGVMAGRANMQALLTSMGEQLPDGPTNPAYCTNPNWDLVKNTLCSAVDLMSNKQQEFMSDICDALSLVISFTATPVERDTREDLAQPARQCDDAKLRCPWVP